MGKNIFEEIDTEDTIVPYVLETEEELMSDEELRETAKQRYKNGHYKSAAIYAQIELWNRKHWFTNDNVKPKDDEWDKWVETEV